MVDDDTATGIQEALQGASSIQLYQMQALIEVMLADTKRMVTARTALHLGQTVRFIDHRTGQERLGKLIAKHDTQATVMEDSVRRTWKIPYVAIAPAVTVAGEHAKPYDPPPEPPAPRGPMGFQVGDKVTFDDAKGVAQVGMITKINRRTATLQTMDARNWRVDFQLLRPVLDV